MEEDRQKVDSSDEVQGEGDDAAGPRGVDEAEEVVGSVDSPDEDNVDDKSNCTSKKAWALPTRWKVLEVPRTR